MASDLQQAWESFRVDPSSPYSPVIQEALFWARMLQTQAQSLQTPQERRQQAELDRMIQHADEKSTLMQITDQAFRSARAARGVDQLTHILDVQGIPRFFSPVDRALLKGFQSFGGYLPGVAMPFVKEKMHRETANVILPAEPSHLAHHLEQRQAEGVRMNVNLLGESLLGEREAEQRLLAYQELLQRPELEVLSVKISTLTSRIQPWARRDTVNRLADRLERLLITAIEAGREGPAGVRVPKFVYLDMEEYRDMELTAEVFVATLDRPGLHSFHAGLALQAYLPDAFPVFQRLLGWADRRVQAGGAPMTVRLVKGANMEMERVDASLHGWPLATFRQKRDTDANYKRMLLEGLRPEYRECLRLGVASHNLFEVGYALAQARSQGALDRVQFEMLEGMANPQRRALRPLAHDLLLYAPACHREQFLHAIGYLVRRLDENTGRDNFLRHAFRLQVDSADWNRLEKRFLDSCARIESVPNVSHRTQNRFVSSSPALLPTIAWTQFQNEPDTDWSLTQHADWAESITRQAHDATAREPRNIPRVVRGDQRLENGAVSQECLDPSRPGMVIGRWWPATESEVIEAIACAQSDRQGWRGMNAWARGSILRGVAQSLREARGELIGVAMAEGGKVITEADCEVSEAIDFVEFYARTAEYWAGMPGFSVRGRGVVVVVSPWNFPLAIPCGGIAAALAAGNCVIVKPASAAVLTAYTLCECFWRAGVSREVLQFFPCQGADVGQQLVTHPGVDAVILTGGTNTAQRILHAKPQMTLLAETGGKNATIVTAMSDREQAIKHVVQSAFGHSGQKCSATSLLILESEVYHDARFRDLLVDAVESLTVGSVWNLATRVGPLIRPPQGPLAQSLRQLEPGESWCVRSSTDPQNLHLVSPAIKWDVRRGSVTHTTEFFGPVLGVMEAHDLDEAIELANATGYGLTAGLESLDDREQRRWIATIRAGNLYLNRPTTGAIVLRQPFGGMGKSGFGPGIQAGGPNYVVPLMVSETLDLPMGSDRIWPEPWRVFARRLHELAPDCDELDDDSVRRVLAAVGSYLEAQQEEFSRSHDHFHLVGQDNQRRYLPMRELRVRVAVSDSLGDILLRLAAARIAGCRVTVSLPAGPAPRWLPTLDALTEGWAASVEFVEEADEELAACIVAGQTDRVRYASPQVVPEIVRRAAHRAHIYLADAPVSPHGRWELLWYHREQAISNNYHRYGNLGVRSYELRREPL